MQKEICIIPAQAFIFRMTYNVEKAFYIYR